MAMPGRRTALVWVRVDAKLAWGVDLHTGPAGQVHESIAGRDLIEPFGDRPDLDAVVATEPHGRDFDGDLLLIKRSITWAGRGLGEITAGSVAPPTETETAAVHAALDYLGYTGPREIRLLLAVDYS